MEGCFRRSLRILTSRSERVLFLITFKATPSPWNQMPGGAR
jgi:hypothetical protein